jgi:hypothetical protein
MSSHLVQGERKVTQHKIFIGGCNSVQFEWINKHTISLWLYKSSSKLRHVVTCFGFSSCLSTTEVQECLSQTQRMFIIKQYLASRLYLPCQNELGDTFPIHQCQTSRYNLAWWTAPRYRRNSSPGCIKHEEKGKCTHRWMRWTFPKLNITPIFVFWFQCHLTNRRRVRNGPRDFSITQYKSNQYVFRPQGVFITKPHNRPACYLCSNKGGGRWYYLKKWPCLNVVFSGIGMLFWSYIPEKLSLRLGWLNLLSPDDVFHMRVNVHRQLKRHI